MRNLSSIRNDEPGVEEEASIHAVGAPGKPILKSTSLSPYKSSVGLTIELPRSNAIPLAYHGSLTQPSSAQVGIAYRSDNERGSGGAGLGSTGKVPVTPGFRFAPSSPTSAASNDSIQFSQRFSSACSISDADPEGLQVDPYDNINKVVSGKDSRFSDGAPSSSISCSPQPFATMSTTSYCGKGKSGAGAMSRESSKGARAVVTLQSRNRRGEIFDGASDTTESPVTESRKSNLQNAETPKLTRGNSYFGGPSIFRQGTLNLRSSRCKRTLIILDINSSSYYNCPSDSKLPSQSSFVEAVFPSG